MKVTKSCAKTIHSALTHWNKEGMLNDEIKASLENDIQILSFDWERSAKHSFWVALICIVISISSLLLDKALLRLLEAILNSSHSLKCMSLSTLSGIIYWISFKQRQKNPEKIFTNEAILFLAILTTSGAVYQFGRALHLENNNLSTLFLISFLIYGMIGFYFRSNLTWIFSLISLGNWLEAKTSYASGGGAYYLGMNYPVRFILFGSILVGLAPVFEKHKKFNHFYQSTLVMGLLYLFISMWILSIFGNHSDIRLWTQIKQIELFHWSLLFGLISGGAIYHGLKYGNTTTKGFGITFLFINLYTRFFEYFWNATHKAIFFGILAISFWILGTKAEKIWYLGENKLKK